MHGFRRRASAHFTVRLDEAGARRVAGAGGKSDGFAAEQTRRRIAEHPRREVLHAGDAEARGDFCEHLIVGAGLGRDEVRAARRSVQFGGEDVGESLGDHVLADGDRGRIPDDTAGGVAHVVVQLVHGDGLESVEHARGRPQREGDVPADAAEPGQPLHLLHEMPVARIAQDHQHSQVGDQDAGIRALQRVDAGVQRGLDAFPRTGVDEGIERGAEFIRRMRGVEPETLPMRVGEIESAGDEVVHARHRCPHLADEVGAVGRVGVEDAGGRGGTVDQSDGHVIRR